MLAMTHVAGAGAAVRQVHAGVDRGRKVNIPGPLTESPGLAVHARA